MLGQMRRSVVKLMMVLVVFTLKVTLFLLQIWVSEPWIFAVPDRFLARFRGGSWTVPDEIST